MQERIDEILGLIDEQLSIVADNYIESSYKARTLASYVQVLNGLLTAQKSYKEENIGARKKQPATDKDNPVVKVSTVAYNALVEIYNESTLSMKDIASLLIVEGSKHVVYDKEE